MFTLLNKLYLIYIILYYINKIVFLIFLYFKIFHVSKNIINFNIQNNIMKKILNFLIWLYTRYSVEFGISLMDPWEEILTSKFISN